MKIKKMFRTLILFAVLMGLFGVQSTQALGTPQIIGINPPSPAQVGTCITIRVRVDWDSEYRSMRVRFGNSGWQESSETEFQRDFCTNGYNPGWYTIRVEVARQGDNSWSNPNYTETQYELKGQSGPPKGPPISQFSFNPSSGAKVGDSINIHIRVDSNNPGATKINVGCGGVSKIETSEVEFDSTWYTSGCEARSYEVLVCSRDVNDPNWANPSCATKSYALSPADVPVPWPTADFWADSTQIPNGQCTYLHWKTTNADRVDIDGYTVQNSGDQQVCPTVTKKYALTASNQSGSANRNLTIVVSDQPAPQNIASYFQTGDVIQIGYDVFVIVDGERRLIPNPETLDALGISRSQINNKGFSNDELMTIPRGEDVPDVNRDPAGFAAFKSAYFPNTIPIATAPGTSIPSNPNATQRPNNPYSTNPWHEGATVGLCKGATIRTGSGFEYPVHTVVPEDNWQVSIIGEPRKIDGVTWWNISRADGGTGWVYFEQAGGCGTVLGISTQDIPRGNITPIPTPTQPGSDDCGFLVDCANASETGESTANICRQYESCGFLDLACYFRNLGVAIDNIGCSSDPIPTTPPQPELQPNSLEAIIQEAATWLKEKYTITYGQVYPNGQCTDLVRRISKNYPGYGSHTESINGTPTVIANGAKQYLDNLSPDKKPVLLKDYTGTVKRCDIILFVGSTYLKYSNNAGHTALVFQATNLLDGIYILEQNYPSGSGVLIRKIPSGSFDDSTYVIPSDCN